MLKSISSTLFITTLCLITVLQVNSVPLDTNAEQKRETDSALLETKVGGEIDTLAERDRRSTDDHFTEEILAQAMCQAYAFQKDLRGRVYAVGRQCPSTSNCRTICESPYLHVQDGQTAHSTWSCIKAFHVYYGRPTTNKSGQQSNAVLGLKSLSFGADDYCDETRCGPNFCCCFALEVDRTV